MINMLEKIIIEHYFTQTIVNEDGSYEYKFRVLNLH